MRRRNVWMVGAGLFALATLALGCASGRVDSRVRIDAPARHVTQIAKSVNGSDLWQVYLDQRGKTATGPQVEFVFEVEQRRFKSYGGDYDPGRIVFDFKAVSLEDGRPLFHKDGEVDLDAFMLASVGRNATRDEIQEVAFRATEEKVYPYMDRWIDLAAIRAMGRAGTDGRVFEETLNDLIEDRWTSSDMRHAAHNALIEIQGG